MTRNFKLVKPLTYTKNMELKITKEKVLDAASKCSTAKATLEVLFPEAFEKPVDARFDGLEELLRKWLDRCDYDIYKSIDGHRCENKSKSVIELIKKTYNL